jgi:3-dehydroquinate synthase
MQTIQANNYPIYFNEQGYEALNLHLNSNKYSTVFIIVDTTRMNSAYPHSYLIETRLKIIEFEAGEENKNIDTCVQFGMFSRSLALTEKSYYTGVVLSQI